MIKPIELDDFCPCESGKVVRDCQCLQPDRSLVPKDVSTWPKGPRTGYAHPNCYASVFRDCCEKISGEHHVTRAILEELVLGGGIQVAGTRWITSGEHKSLPVKALQSNVLCKRHNSALSNLDKVGLKFFKTLRSIHRNYRQPDRDKQRRLYLFNGHDIERWMLKLLCGAIASKNHSTNIPIDTLQTEVPEKWLRVLYGFDYLKNDLGLYYVDLDGEARQTLQGVAYNVVWDGTFTEILGVYISVNSMGFFLALASPKEHNLSSLLPELHHRLGGLSFVGPDTRRNEDKDRHTIKLGWRLQQTVKGKNIVIGASEEINLLFKQ